MAGLKWLVESAKQHSDAHVVWYFSGQSFTYQSDVLHQQDCLVPCDDGSEEEVGPIAEIDIHRIFTSRMPVGSRTFV
eukprot:COSAG06_NODE_16231_length_1012_cov_1.015334_2_plen_76_part_01